MRIEPSCVWTNFQAIQKLSPLVHNITNFVVMEQTANCLLAIGASPVMAHALEEVEDMARMAHALVLNLGTLSPAWVEAMGLAQKAANARGISVVLDPVGAGATPYRTEAALSLLDNGTITAIRGNASEIASLHGISSQTRGVDSKLDAADCQEIAKALAHQRNCIVWMSGSTDVITDGKSIVLVRNGHAWMSKVTGMGCTATAVTAAFLATNSDPLLACAYAAIVMGTAGELASERATGPGSFKTAFSDVLFNMTLTQIQEHIDVEMRN
ncbi:MAG: hydroxyethylthiazole kinase [Chlamydiota bacterium]